MRIRLRGVLKAFGYLLAVAVALPMLLIFGSLAWIAYWPVPVAPHYGTRYTVSEVNNFDDTSLYFYRNPLSYGWRLKNTGQVIQLSKAAQEADQGARKAAEEKTEKSLGLPQDDYSNRVVAVAPNGDALVMSSTLGLWRGGRCVATMAHGVRGYSWKPQIDGFYVLNNHGEAIGDGEIATGYATSGGTSDPHGRWMPLLWHEGNTPPEDLNGWLAPASGWYLDKAVDLNDRGEILCIGRRTDAKGAERYRKEDARWVVLMPQP